MCMCDFHKKDINRNGDEDMNVIEDVKIDIKQSINKSLDEVEKIEKGLLPKRSYKHMLERVKHRLNEEE